MKWVNLNFPGRCNTKSVNILHQMLFVVILLVVFCIECFAQENRVGVYRPWAPDGRVGRANNVWSFISPDVATKITPRPGMRVNIRETWARYRQTGLEEIFFETSAGKRHRMIGKSSDNYDFFLRRKNEFIYFIYIDFKAASQSDDAFSAWWQSLLDNPDITMQMPRSAARDMEIRQNFPSRDLVLRWWEISPKLPPVCMEALKQDVHRATGIVFPPWMRENIVESFEKIHESADPEIEERVFFISTGSLRGTIWRIFIGPFFIVYISDGLLYRLKLPDMASSDLRQSPLPDTSPPPQERRPAYIRVSGSTKNGGA